MKTRLIALVALAGALAGCSDLNKPTSQPALPTPEQQSAQRAYQMQVAILKDGNIRMVDELLKQGVDVNAPIGLGSFSPLDGAVTTQNFEMLKFLLMHGAKPRGRELTEAALYADPQTATNFVKLLLAAGVNPNATNNLGGTALSSAANQGNHALVALLLAQPHINVNAPDGGGWTALMYAADHGSVDIVDLLVKAGADPRLKNSSGQTAAALAQRGIASRQAVISKLQSPPR